MRQLLIRRNKLLFVVIGLTAVWFSQARVVWAYDLFPNGLRGKVDDLGLKNTPPKIVAINVISSVLTFLGLIALALIIYSGFRWMLARGNDEEVTKAKETLRAAVIGLLIILASLGITDFIFSQLEGAAGIGGTGTP